MDDLGPLPKVKKYDDQYRKAKQDISNTLFELKGRHELSDVQFLAILTDEVANLVTMWTKQERADSD